MPEHYEMAAYGTLSRGRAAWVTTKPQSCCSELDEERPPTKLSALAEGSINQKASEAVHPDEEEEEGDEDKLPARRRQSRSATAVAKRPRG